MFLALRTLGWNLTDCDRGADSGPVIVIVSGYFSPLHCGHLDYLEEAAAAGDRLVVIVNNNEQQILKKGGSGAYRTLLFVGQLILHLVWC